MPAAAFVDRKKVEEEKAQAEQAQQAADVAAEDAKAEAERGIREWLLEVLHDPRKIVKLIKRYRWASIMAAAAMSMALIFYLVVCRFIILICLTPASGLWRIENIAMALII